MSDEQERDAAVIARSAQRHADLRALTTLNCVRIEETALLIRVANAGADLIRVQHLTIDRLTAERDAARAELAKLRAACKVALRWLDSSGYGEDHDAITAIEAAAAIRAALGSEVGDHGPSPEELYRFQNDDGEAPE